MMIKPFTAHVPQEIINDLKVRLADTRWPDEITDAGWEYGTNLSYLKELADYWLTTFDWRQVEAEINAYPNFIADIDGYQVHFIHVKGKGKKSVPLIITHGWPGSFLEMLKLIPLLTTDPDFSFDLVIPSLIGFGFSRKVNRPGCNSAVIAGLWHQLMQQLGYDQYGAQGGDIGSGVSAWLGLNYPENMVGLHLNYIPGSYKPYTAAAEQLTDEVINYQKTAADWANNEGAYARIQATKPMTLAYGLTDSPIGLCAWILEKFNSWSDNHGHVENAFTKNEILADVTLYWVTETIRSSVHIYNENSKKPLALQQGEFIKVPVAFAKFPGELPTPPRPYIEKGFNIQRWTEMPAGGHFAALEQPELLAKDITAFFRGL